MLNLLNKNDSLEKRKYHDQIWREKINLMSENARPSNVFSFLLALVISWMLWPHDRHQLIICWITTMTLIAGIRIVIAVYERRSEINGKSHKFASRLFLTSILMTAVGWGVAGYTLFPLRPAELQFLMGLVFAGIVANYSLPALF